MDPTQTDTTAVITISAVSVWLIQKLKSVAWVPFIQEHSKVANTIASVATAFVAAAGIHVGFVAASGTLTITGLTITGVATGLWLAGKSFVFNELIYQSTLKRSGAVTSVAEVLPDAAIKGVQAGIEIQKDRAAEAPHSH